MKRCALLVAALATMAGMVIPTGTASAATALVANCNGHRLLSANYVTSSSGARLGAIQLCVDGDSYFAIYINYGSMPAEQFANAWLYRYRSGEYQERWSCDSPGGTGHVVPGETWCATPKIGPVDWPGRYDTFRAPGFVYIWARDKWELLGSGWTARCNALPEPWGGCQPE